MNKDLNKIVKNINSFKNGNKEKEKLLTLVTLMLDYIENINKIIKNDCSKIKFNSVKKIMNKFKNNKKIKNAIDNINTEYDKKNNNEQEYKPEIENHMNNNKQEPNNTENELNNNYEENNNYINSSKRVYLRSDIIKNKLNAMNQISLNKAEQYFKNMN